MVLRRYQTSDFDALYALDRLCFVVPFRFSRVLLRQVLEQREAVVLVATEVEGQSESITGFCAAEIIQESQQASAYLSTLDVHPRFRERGIGRALLKALDAELRKLGVSAVTLHVFQDNHGAIRFYEALGFARVGEERHFYGLRLHAWVYARACTALNDPSCAR